jgi:hypothetical protein
MAIETKTLPSPAVDRTVSGPQKSSATVTPERNSARTLDWESPNARVQTRRLDIFLYHSVSDEKWAGKLFERIGREHLGNRDWHIALRSLAGSSLSDVLQEMEISARKSAFFGIVVSASMLRNDRPALEKVLDVLSNFPQTNGRILTILKDNVSMPAFLRLREWIDFREDKAFETGVQELLMILRADSAARNGNSLAVVKKESNGRDSRGIAMLPALSKKQVKERIVSNLFPVLETPEFVYSAETPCRTDAEVMEACGGPGPLPFLLKDSRLYTFQSFAHDSVFEPASSKGAAPLQENFAQWLSSSDRVDSALYLLNSLFRHHAWKRGLRYDKSRNLYYFTRSKPKNVLWKMGQQAVSREVTAPNMAWIPLENQMKAEVQYGWRHLGIRAGFVQILGTLFLRLEPTWHLTELDGKTSAANQEVGPVLSDSRDRERNGQVLRSLRFWSVVLAKGHQELRINTASSPMRARLTPLSGFSPSGIQSDRMDYDQLMLAETQDDLSIPELGPIRQESAIHHEEDISSETRGNLRDEQPQTRS